MADIKFLNNLKSYDKDNIPDSLLNKVKPIVNHPDFDPALITNKNKAAGGMAKWCKALCTYTLALKVIKPKEKTLRETTEKYMETLKILEVK